MLKIKNQTDTSAELYIYGDIVDDNDGAWLKEWHEDPAGYQWPKEIKEQLDSLKGKDLTIYINSNGGYVNAGVAMANMIARHDGHTVAVVDGFCCSIATQIFFAADEQRMPSNAYLMIHKPSAGVYGDADDLLRAAEMLDVIQEGLETTYRKHARDGITEDDIGEMVDKTTWLTGAEASKIFDISLTESMEAVACFGSRAELINRHYGNIPDGLTFKNVVDEPSKAADDKYKMDAVAISIAKAKGALAK